MNFKFGNLLGVPYRGGNITFNKHVLLLSAVGNRVSVTDLQKSEFTTLRCENGKSVSRIEVPPMVLALRLEEPELIRKCIESVVSSIPVINLVALCTALGEYIVNSVHLKFLLLWCQEVIAIHGKTLEACQAQMLPVLRGLQKSLICVHEDLSDLCSSNLSTRHYLSAAPSPLSLAPATP